MRTYFLLAALTLCAFTHPLSAQSQQSDEQMKLQFLIGEWKTSTTRLATGTVTEGDLQYKWVLGGAWVKITFIGHPEDGSVWEAHGFMKYDGRAGHYVSHVVFSDGDMVTYNGEWISEDTFRVSSKVGENYVRINYTKQKDGTIFQLNEISRDGENWQTTIETSYAR